MKPFEEADRYRYDLNRYSIVWDCGAHKGAWSEAMSNRYKCHIIAFEPVKEFLDIARKRLEGHSNVEVVQLGIGATTKNATFCIKGDMTGLYAMGNPVPVQILGIKDALDSFNCKTIDLIKINVEGMEYEILETVLAEGLAERFVNFQIQPHGVAPDSGRRWDKIREGLSHTHELTYDAPGVWSNWRLNYDTSQVL